MTCYRFWSQPTGAPVVSQALSCCASGPQLAQLGEEGEAATVVFGGSVEISLLGGDGAQGGERFGFAATDGRPPEARQCLFAVLGG